MSDTVLPIEVPLARSPEGQEPTPLTEQNPAHLLYKKPSNYISNPDAIVIGSGIGGLGVASFLTQRRGMRVLVLEANEVPGGCTHVHELGGFEFPSGLDSVGDMDASVGRGMNRPNMDAATGGKLDWVKMPDMHEKCQFGDDSYEFFSSHEKNIANVEKLFPGQGDIRKYYKVEDKIEAAAVAWGLTKFYPQFLPEGVRDFVYKMTGSTWRTAMSKTATDVMTKELGFSDKLASVFSYMYGNYGRLPKDAPWGMHATFLAHYRHGAYYPVGGPGQIGQTMIPIIERGGGQVAVSSPVEKIIVENNRAVGVKLEDGTEIRSKFVVSDAGAYTTFAQLLDKDAAAQHGLVARFGDIKPSPAHMFLMAGWNQRLDLPKHIIWHMANGGGHSPYDITNADTWWKDNMSFDHMACYMMAPSERDPSHVKRYPNKSTVMVLAEARPEWVEKSKKDPAFKAEFEGKLKDSFMKLVNQHMPGTRGKAPDFIAAGAPVGCNPRAWAASSYGIELAKERFFSQTHWLRPQTAVKGLFLTGQDAFLPGICGSLLGARFSYAAIARDPFFLLP